MAQSAVTKCSRVRHQMNLAAKAMRTIATTPSRAICSQRFLARATLVVKCVPVHHLPKLFSLYFRCRASLMRVKWTAPLSDMHGVVKFFFRICSREVETTITDELQYGPQRDEVTRVGVCHVASDVSQRKVARTHGSRPPYEL